MKAITAIVQAGQQQFSFGVQPHIAQQVSQLLMEQVEYYQKYTGKIPPMPHIELEIVSLPPQAEGVKLHIHPVKDKRFICWTQHVKDNEKANFVFRLWCLGSVYTILTGKPFETYLFNDEIKGDSDAFEAGLQKEFDLSFVLC